MDSTLLKRLRLSQGGAVPLHVSHYQKDCGDAADEIERLRAEINQMKADREAERESDALAGYGWHDID